MPLFPEKILLVDDDINLLSAFARQFHGKLNLDTAEGAMVGLGKVREAGPYAVVVADMRMPEMNGIQFLTKVHEQSPETVRIMLTGNADIETAMHAVNEADIFRFLTKPCHKATFEWAVEAAIQQYRLVTAEQVLLEKTLKGSIQVLIDILGLVNPTAFSRGSRLRTYTSQIAASMKIEGQWQIELAALLSQIGCVTVPADTLANSFAGNQLSPGEEKQYNMHPTVGAELLERIPRLEAVAYMVKNQLRAFRDYTPDEQTGEFGFMEIGAQLLKVVIDFDTFLSRGFTTSRALGDLKKHKDLYNPKILQLLGNVEMAELDMVTCVVDILDLDTSMVLAEDVLTKKNVLIAAKGQHVTSTMRQLMRNYYERKEINDSIRVNISAGVTKQQAASIP